MTTAGRTFLLVTLGAAMTVAAAAQTGPLTRKPAQVTDVELARLTDDLAREVEQLRGWKFKQPVRKQRVSLAQAQREMTRMLQASLSPARRARREAFLRTVGLIPQDCDLLSSSLEVLEQQVAGYYEPASRTLHLVDRPGEMPAFVERMILSHELTHALDDQYIDLADLVRPDGRTEDMDFVATSLVEGSATALMLQHMQAAQKSGRFNLAELSGFLSQEMERARTLEALPRYFSAMFGSYIVGAAFLAKGDLQKVLAMPDNRAIGEALVAARRSLPRSGEQILHPEKYWKLAARDEPVTVDDRTIERWLRRPGRWVVHRETLGELLTAIFTEPRDAARDLGKFGSAGAWTNPGATGWAGDRFFLLASGPSQAAAERELRDLKGVWITAWDTPGDCGEFVQALGAGTPPPNSTVSIVANKVAVIVIGFDRAEHDALIKRMETGPIPFVRNGRPWRS